MAQGKTDDLEAFAKRIETRVKKGGPTDSMEREFCRLLAGKKTPPNVQATLLAKWVEWRYGKPKERHEVTGPEGGAIEHVITFVDSEKDDDA